MQDAGRHGDDLVVMVPFLVDERIREGREATCRVDGARSAQVVGGGVEEACGRGPLQDWISLGDELDERSKARRRLAQLLRGRWLACNIREGPDCLALALSVGRPLIGRLEETEQRRNGAEFTALDLVGTRRLSGLHQGARRCSARGGMWGREQRDERREAVDEAHGDAALVVGGAVREHLRRVRLQDRVVGVEQRLQFLEAALQAHEHTSIVLVEGQVRERGDGSGLRVARVGVREHLEQLLNPTQLADPRLVRFVA